MERLFNNRLARVAQGAIRAAAETRLPPVVLEPAIQVYARMLSVDLEEARVPDGGFASFAEFFARRLRHDVRPVSDDRDAVVAPCDGEVVDAGEVRAGASPRMAIKGSVYGVGELLGDEDEAEDFDGGVYQVFYLHPRDYHRVHVPADGALERVRHVPGTRFPVADWAERRIAGVFGRNERLVFRFETRGRPLAVVMVAAFGVGDLASPYLATARAPRGRGAAITARELAPPARLTRGDELGAFRLGSTVVVLGGRDAYRPVEDLVGRRVRFGGRVGTLGEARGPRDGEREAP